MKKIIAPDGVLVYDRYYGSKPIVGVLVAERIIFCALLSAFSMLFIIEEYGFNVSSLFVGFISALCSVIFSVLFIFVKRSIAIPTLFLASGLVVYLNFQDIWIRFSYFIDEAMLLVDGRFLFPRGYLIHDERYLVDSNALYHDGMYLGTFLLCGLYALLCAASMKKRIRCIPSLLGFVLLCIPRLLSETFEFNLWLVPVILLFVAAAAIGTVYKNGLAVVKTGAGSYRRQVRSDERTFLDNIKRSGYIKRIGMRFSFFSKYFTSGLYCVVLFAVALGIGVSSFGEGDSMDYTPVYDWMMGIGKDVVPDSSFDDGPVSDYFSSSGDQIRGEGLNITSPGNGDKEIIKVSFSGDRPIYLRGDIGIEYTGDGWTTPVIDQRNWLGSGISQHYRPCEVDVVRTLLSALDSNLKYVVTETDVIIDYLCETDVVFLPAYTAEYSYYEDQGFVVYGDHVVRVNTDSGDYVRSVQCTSLDYDLNGFSFFSDEEIIAEIEKIFINNGLSVNDFYGTVVPEMASEDDLILKYTDYVESTYLSLPADIGRQLRIFMRNSMGEIIDIEDYYGVSSPEERYKTAELISDYLKNNYTYTLSGVNNSDSPVIEFLTETQKGHCSLYASAMTLMLRELGIPARYCTGFSVYPTGQSANTVTLRERNLHAWVEVYLGELGWVTFDPTSGAMNAGQNTNSPEEESSQPVIETDEPSRPEEETKEISSLPENTSGENSNDVVVEPDVSSVVYAELIVIISISCLVIITAILLIFRYYSVKSRAEDIVNKAELLSSGTVYATIIEILYLCKLKPLNGQLPSDYYREVDKAMCTSISAKASVLEKAAFGSSELTDEEMSALCTAFREVFTSSTKRCSVFRRHRIRYIVLSAENRG